MKERKLQKDGNTDNFTINQDALESDLETQSNVTQQEYFLKAEATKKCFDTFYFIIEAENEKEAMIKAKNFKSDLKIGTKKLEIISDITDDYADELRENSCHIYGFGRIYFTWTRQVTQDKKEWCYVAIDDCDEFKYYFYPSADTEDEAEEKMLKLEHHALGKTKEIKEYEYVEDYTKPKISDYSYELQGFGSILVTKIDEINSDLDEEKIIPIIFDY